MLEPPMRAMVTMRMILRPSVSPRRPKTSPPIGRAANPTAYVANAAMVPPAAPSGSKNSLPKISALARP